MYLQSFMRSYQADHACDSLQQRISLTKHEIESAQLMHNYWLIKLLGATQAQVYICLDTYTEEIQDF